MLHLPVELMWQICFNLCTHCHSPDALPHADTTEERQAKAALARLSRSSKYMHAIAQPYVFHYFATGNMIRHVGMKTTARAIGLTDLYQPYTDESGKGCRPSHDNDHLPLFLRSIIRRPGLAAHVEALQLVSSPNVDDLTDPDMEVISGAAEGADAMSRTSPAFQMITKASVDLGIISTNIFHPEFRGRSSVLSGVGPPNHENQTEYIHHALEQLAIMLCPNVSTLVYGYPLEKRSIMTGESLQVDRGERPQFWTLALPSPRLLTSLKRLALLSHSRTQHFCDGQIMLCTMPNVEILYGAHFTYPGPPTDTIGLSLWVNPMPNIRKLLVVDMSPYDLGCLLNCCLDLQDLEYRHQRHSDNSLSIDGGEILRQIYCTRETLRRLVLVVMSDGDPRADFFLTQPIPTLRMFKRLEELAVNQSYLPSDSSASSTQRTQLARVLPRSLKKLHILYLWHDGLMGDLERLARDAPIKAPNLKSVRVSHLDHEDYIDPESDSEDWFPVPVGRQERVRDVLAGASISLTWDRLKYKLPLGDASEPGESARPCAYQSRPVPFRDPSHSGGSYLSTPYWFWEASDSLGVLS